MTPILPPDKLREILAELKAKHTPAKWMREEQESYQQSIELAEVAIQALATDALVAELEWILKTDLPHSRERELVELRLKNWKAQLATVPDGDKP